MNLIIKYVLIFILAINFGKAQVLKFDFGTDHPQSGYLKVEVSDIYNSSKGYGFLSTESIKQTSYGKKKSLTSSFISSEKPFFFAVDLPEGNYDINLVLGDKRGTSSTTLKAENRRLMLENAETHWGKTKEEIVTVHLRTPKINDSERVAIKPREKQYPHWDNKLTLEFTGKKPKICGLQITKTETLPTVFLAGNSTVVDQAIEPWAAWGQMIPRFFEGGKLAFANYAESGETIRSFVLEKRLDKILSWMKPGDYLFIEFAHNDQKPNSGVFAQTTYKDFLREYIQKTREKGATPVLVTSMHRRKFDQYQKIINTLEDFPDAMRDIAKEQNVALIDLNLMSKTLFEALGEEQSKKAFVHYQANSFPNNPNEIHDDTHFSNYGAYQLAKCVVEGIKKADLELKKFIVKDYHAYNPSLPDILDFWNFPASPFYQLVQPD